MKNLLITGVSSGIGAAMAEHFLNRDYRVFGTVRNIEDAAPLQDKSEYFHPLVVDVTDEAGVRAMGVELEERLGGEGLSGLVNNAGAGGMGPILAMPLQQVRKVFDVNFFGAVHVTQVVWPLLRGERPGRIVNISSVSGAFAVPFGAAYAGSKHALEAFNQAIRRELKPLGIHSCVICPGFVKSRMSEQAGAGDRNPAMDFYQDTPWADAWRAFLLGAQQSVKNAKPPAVVCQAAQHALESDHPNTRYALDPVYHLGRHMSDEEFDEFLLSMIGVEDELG